MCQKLLSQMITLKAFMANVGKKVNLFSLLSFCFAKSDLRVWEEIWGKSGRKMIEVMSKTWNLFVFSKRSNCQDIWKEKNEEQTLASFSSYIACLLFTQRFFLQQFLKLMSKIRKNDGYWWFTRILNFVSKTFRMAAFTFSSDLLFGYHQHLQFSTNAFTESGREKTVNLVFIVPQNFGTKIKIQKKVLTFCWIARVLFWRKVFFGSRAC